MRSKERTVIMRGERGRELLLVMNWKRKTGKWNTEKATKILKGEKKENIRGNQR